MMFWYDHNLGWWGYAGMGIGMVLFWALVIGGIFMLIRLSSAGATGASTSVPQRYSASPEQVLADRFARGEIDEAEYQHRLQVLRGLPRQ